LYQNLYHLGTPPILNDEPTYTVAAQRYLTGNILPPVPPSAPDALHFTHDNFEHPPLVKFLFGIAEWLDRDPTSMTAARAVSAAAAMLAALVIAVWIGRVAGRWTGLLAGGLLTVLPEAAGSSLGRFDRFAMLDTTASMFMVFSVVLAWLWAHRTGRAAWIFAAATGVAVGWASGSKENGFLGAVGPVLLMLGTSVAERDRRAILTRLGQTLAACALAVIAFLALYVPFSHPIARIRYLIAFQTSQSNAGHLVGFDGQVTAHPPWWTNLWFAGHAYGSVLTVFLVAAALCAVVLRRDRLVAWCLTALAGPFVFHCFIAHVALSYYWVMWTPFFLTLSALGVAEVVRRVPLLAAGNARIATPLAILTGVAVLAVPLTESFAESVTVADLKPTGVMVVPKLVRADRLTGDIVSAGIPAFEFDYYTPKTKVYYSAKTPVTGADLIVIGQPMCRELIDQSVRALVTVNLKAGSVKKIYTDSQIVVYEATGPLTMPSAAQIAAEPAGSLTDNC
jgi:4-amino-4-deoxy-L-arabinose transferase-like glycosyltransferase